MIEELQRSASRYHRGSHGSLDEDIFDLYITNWFRNHTVIMQTADPLSLTFAALADPTRRAILARLLTGECTVGEIAKPFSMTGPAVSKHLKVLERAGLIARGRDAQWRPCRLTAAPIKQVAEWADGYRRVWDASDERLDGYLTRLKSEEQGG